MKVKVKSAKWIMDNCKFDSSFGMYVFDDSCMFYDPQMFKYCDTIIDIDNENLYETWHFAPWMYDVVEEGVHHDQLECGLTKREYLAAKAIQGICVNAGRNSHSFDNPTSIAKTAIKIADALINELNK